MVWLGISFCFAYVALLDATFAERKATLINSQPRSEKRDCIYLATATNGSHQFVDLRGGLQD